MLLFCNKHSANVQRVGYVMNHSSQCCTSWWYHELLGRPWTVKS